MPRDTRPDRPDGTAQNDRHDAARTPTGPDARVSDAAPSLATLLRVLRSAASGDDGSSVAHSGEAPAWVPLEAPVDESLRSDLLEAIRRELGEPLGDAASLSLKDAPLSKSMAEKVLQAAVNVSAARRAALASAGLVAGGVEPPVEAPDAEQAAIDEERHQALLAFCAELVRTGTQGPGDARTVDEAAAHLHDRVRAFLQRRGHWPIADTGVYEAQAKPAALVMVEWSTSDTS